MSRFLTCCALALAALTSNGVAARPIVQVSKPEALASSAPSPSLLPFPGTAVSPTAPTATDGEYCADCVNMMVVGINAILAEIERLENPKCTQLCQVFPEGSLRDQLCVELCEMVGVVAFIAIVSETGGADFIAPCDLLGVCPTQDCPEDDPQCITLGQMTASPAAPTKDETVTFSLPLNVTAPKGVGTGMITASLCPIAEATKHGGWCESGSGNDNLVADGYAPGSYPLTITLDTTGMDAGEYLFSLEVCEGTCMGGNTPPGTKGKHRGQREFGLRNATFTHTV